MALGIKLREARMRMGETTSQVAAATRMKVQMVEAIEREDFSSVPAPIYGKGFIKLFAEHVGLDPAPLVDEYMERFVHSPDKKILRSAKMRRPAHAENNTPPGTTPAVARSQNSAHPSAGAAIAPDNSGIRTGIPPAGNDTEPEDLFALAARKNLNSVQTASNTASINIESTPSTSQSEIRKKAKTRKNILSPGLIVWREKVLMLLNMGVQVLRNKAIAVRNALKNQRFDVRKIRFAESPLKTAMLIVGVLVLVIFILSAFSRFVRRAPAPTANTSNVMRLAIDPPAPYFE